MWISYPETYTISYRWDTNPAMKILWCMLALAVDWTRADLVRKTLSDNALAVCNNGEQAVFYMEEAGSEQDFLIGLQGGGQCHKASQCIPRCRIGSEDYKYCHPPGDASVSLAGIFSHNPNINPGFNTYRKIFVPYCSSDFFSGNETASSSTGNVHLRGKEIFLTVVDYLSRHANIKSAKRVVLAGTEAGGSGVLANCDLLSELLPGVDVKCIADSPMLNPPTMEWKSELCILEGWRSSIFMKHYIPEFWNGVADASCTAGTTGNCYDPSVVLPFIQQPIVFTSNLFDKPSLEQYCVKRLAYDHTIPSYLDDWGHAMTNFTRTIVGPASTTALYVPICYGHGLISDDVSYSSVSADTSRSLAQSLATWVGSGAVFHNADTCLSTGSPCTPRGENCPERQPGNTNSAAAMISNLRWLVFFKLCSVSSCLLK